MEYASTHEKSFHACFYGIVLYGMFLTYAFGMAQRSMAASCFAFSAGLSLLASLHATLCLFGSVKPSSEMRLA
jgi:hypothetical protein